MWNKLKKASLPFLLVVLTGCVSFSIKDTADAIVTAKATLAGVNNTIAAMVTNKQLSSQKAELLAAKADEAETMLVTAQSLLNQNLPKDAMEVLQAANKLLLELQKALEEEARK